eukprot:14066728-Alexandrium_andersonii.AAC.1
MAHVHQDANDCRVDLRRLRTQGLRVPGHDALADARSVGGLALLHAHEEERLVDVLPVRLGHHALAGDRLVLPEELVGVPLGDDAGVL